MKKVTHFKPCVEKNLSLEIVYYLLGTCNYNCEYCYWRDLKYKEKDYISQTLILNELFKITKKSNLFLFGGEPTLCTYFENILDYIFENKPNTMSVELQTHGEFKPKYIEIFKKYDISVSVSIHYNNIKNIKGLIKNIISLKYINKLERIDFMFEEKNIAEQRLLFKILKQHNLLELIIPTFGYMNLPKFNKQYSNQAKLYDIFKDCIEQCGDKEKYEIAFDDEEVKVKDASELYEEHLNFKGWQCFAGQKMIIIDNDGNYSKCTSSYFYDKIKSNIFKNTDAFFNLINSNGCICTYDKCNWDLWINKIKST